MIRSYEDFYGRLMEAGFSSIGGNDENVYSLFEQIDETTCKWHTGDPETDPWEWRIRVFEKRDEIIYSKIFFRKTGFITREWYPYFLAARRDGKSFDDEYAAGTISQYAKRIYDAVSENGKLPLEEIKHIAKFTREEKSRFDNALVELQMRFYLMICGERRKISRAGEEYGWPSTVFCAVETFWGDDVLAKAAQISADEAAEVLMKRIMELNPQADKKKVLRFIKG